MWRMLMILLAVALAAAACTSADTTTTPAPTTSAPTSTTTTMPATTQAPTTTTTEPAAKRVVRTYDVDGIEVVVMTEVEELPQRAELIEYSTLLIDEGEGPMMCLGPYMTSYPPQCFGPVIEGLDISGWAEEANGIYFGPRTVVVTWPAVDDRIQLVSESEHEPLEPVFAVELPEHCADIDRFPSTKAIQDYSRSLGAQSGGLYVTDDGTLVLQVTDDPEPHREALSGDGREACVVQVSTTAAELLRIQDDLFAQITGADYASSRSVVLGVTIGNPGGAGGRIEISVLAADLDTVEAIAALVEDRTVLRIIGEGVLLDTG